MNDPSPFTLLAFLLATAKRRGVDWRAISGTSNQSDYLSHYVANHMFFRIALPGARRILTDHIEFCNRHVPNWNPMSVVGQHMQQAGATPAEAMAFTLASAIQYAEDCIARGMDAGRVPAALHVLLRHLDVSLFEEIAKFRAGRRIWARITRERFGARDPRSWRFKFHGQTSGVDLTRQQPLNNIARVTVQAMAGILGGLQSLHTDAYDEALSCPTEFGARIAVATQNILREEAHLTDVIDPLGGSYYVETLTDEMEAEDPRVMAQVEDAGGMYAAVEQGLVQKNDRRIGARASRRRSSRASRPWSASTPTRSKRTAASARRCPSPTREDAGAYRRVRCVQGGALAGRGASGAGRASPRAAGDPRQNIFARVVEAAEAGCTHGEICATLRRELGFGQLLVDGLRRGWRSTHEAEPAPDARRHPRRRAARAGARDVGGGERDRGGQGAAARIAAASRARARARHHRSRPARASRRWSTR